MSGDTVLSRALHCRIGETFGHLFAGSTRGSPAASAADMALCSYLAFWTQAPGQIDRLMRRSALYKVSAAKREEWDTARGTSPWGADLLQQALTWTAN